MAILSAAFLPILALQGQFVQSVRAVERADFRMTQQRNAVAYLKNLNFTRFPNGDTALGDVTMEWASSPVYPAQSGWFNEASEARYNMTLYKVDVRLTNEAGFEERFEMKGLGWSAKWRVL